MKDHLPENAAIVLFGCAENYSFVVQDEIKSFHGNNLQATLHSIVVYQFQNGKLAPKTFYVIIHGYHPGMYVACVYNKEWFLGFIVKESIANEDIKIKFINKNMEKNSFSWPVREDTCRINVTNVLCRITKLSA